MNPLSFFIEDYQTKGLRYALKLLFQDLEDRATWVNDVGELEYLALFLFFRCLGNFRRNGMLFSPFEEGYYQFFKTCKAWLVLIKCPPEKIHLIDNPDWELRPSAFRLWLNRNYEGKCAPWELRWYFDPDSQQWVSSPSFP